MRLVGLVILIIGAMFLGFGLISSFSDIGQVIQGVSGHSENTVWYISGGIALIVIACGLLLLGGSRGGKLN